MDLRVLRGRLGMGNRCGDLGLRGKGVGGK